MPRSLTINLSIGSIWLPPVAMGCSQEAIAWRNSRRSIFLRSEAPRLEKTLSHRVQRSGMEASAKQPLQMSEVDVLIRLRLAALACPMPPRRIGKADGTQLATEPPLPAIPEECAVSSSVLGLLNDVPLAGTQRPRHGSRGLPYAAGGVPLAREA